MIGESIKKGFAVTASSWILVAIFFAYGSLTNILNLRLNNQLQGAQVPGANTSFLTAGVIVSVLAILFGVFLQAGSMAYVRDRVRTGTASLGTLVSGGFKYYLRLFFFGAVIAFIVAIVVGVAIIVLNLLPAAMRLPGAIIVGVVAVIGMYLVLLLFLAPYVIVLDEQGAITGMKQSMALVQRNILPTLGVGLILIVIGFCAGLVSGILMGVLSAVLRTSPSVPYVTAVITAFVNGFLGVFMTAVYTNFYLRLKSSNPPAAVS